MSKIHVIDLAFLEEQQTIGAFLIESSVGPILVETGPESTWDQLKRGINNLGYETSDVKHVLLTHIHFDHAGAAWRLADSGAKIYVHPVGLPHLESPERLWNSAAKIYGDDMKRLWGEMKSISGQKLRPCRHGETFQFGEIEIKALHTPGHAVHHIAWEFGEIIFTGDVAGVKVNDGPVVPPCPPPDIHIEDWKESLSLLRAQNPKALYLTHFGRVEHPTAHLKELEETLDQWASWMKGYYQEPFDQGEVTARFVAYTEGQFRIRGVGKEDLKRYEKANPSWMSVAGLLRYWKLKDQGRID